jgi:hypothetical protein
MISYLQAVDVIRTFAINHLQIKRFGFEFREQMPNIVTTEESFPYLFVVPVGSNSLQNVREIDFDVYCVDKYQSERNNVPYIISDTDLILADLTLWLEEGQDDIEVVGSYSITPINNDLLDYVGGHVMRLRVQVDRIALCEIPFDGDAPVPPVCPSGFVRNSDNTYTEIVLSGGTLVLPDITVTDSDGSTFTQPAVTNVVCTFNPPCEDATYSITDTDDTVLYSGSIPSGGNLDQVIQDSTYLVEYVNGTPIESGNILAEGSLLVQVPNPIVCDDAIVNINSVFFSNVPSGGTENIIVRQSTGSTQVGSIQGQYFRIADSTAVVKNSVNTVISTTSIKAEDSEDIILPDETITITDELGNPLDVITFPVYSTLNIDIDSYCTPCPPAVTRSTATLMKTGQTTSYRTGDDGDIEAGRATDFLTLDSAPLHNDGSATLNTTTARFTDTLGGSTYANDIVLDWSTWNGSTLLGWRRTSLGLLSWNNGIDNSLSLTFAGFAIWRMPNNIEINSIANFELTAVHNYSPFNINSEMWSSTTYAPATSSAWRIQAVGVWGVSGKTNSRDVYPVRTFSLSTLNVLS